MREEKKRLKERKESGVPWMRWGPYLSEREWGTVREDYSSDGTPWEYFTYEMAQSRAYRWGEDGIGGISDWKQRLCFSVALWNGKDSHLKERLFGLDGHEGNHGEDVKEYYYYLDSTPTHSYMKMLYKYPQSKFPYELLRSENRRRGRGDPEFELIDTGIFNENRYFDVFIEYAKVRPNDLLIKITAWNRGPEAAPLDIVPQLWFRNKWSWNGDSVKPKLQKQSESCIIASHEKLGGFFLFAEGDPKLLFCENDTNVEKLYGVKGDKGYFKDGLNDAIVNGQSQAVNSKNFGTKLGLQYHRVIEPNSSVELHLRLTNESLDAPFNNFSLYFDRSIREADAFYEDLQRDIDDADLKNVQRQALAGLLWTKQYYHFDIKTWLQGDPGQPKPPEQRKRGRNADWDHLYNEEIISMPDKWEYPWYAGWDLAFHCLPLSLVDVDFAKEQLLLMTREWYMHPNGQLPAYEWSFGDVNPPVHAWAAWRVYQIDRNQNEGQGDFSFLERVFHKLMINFTWWVNRKDPDGRNLFQGGFLGLDNIGVFDRNVPLPVGETLNQADATSWMAMYSLNLMRISIELALHDQAYEDIASKFFEHFLHIAGAMTKMADQQLGLWDEEDGFYYDAIKSPDGRVQPLKVRSMVGLIPLFAVETLEPETLKALPMFHKRLKWLLDNRPDLSELISHWQVPGEGHRRLLSLLRGHRMKLVLKRMLDETEFLSPHGVRSLSKYHQQYPYNLNCMGLDQTVRYSPGASDSPMFGGNSNWRGPIWFPVNFLIIESLQKFHHYYGDDFKIECPTGSGHLMTILEVSEELSRRLVRIFSKDKDGRRPAFSRNEKFQVDPLFKDHILFYEYFHGDTGWGVGASHQTGWTGLVAKLIQPRKGRSEVHDAFLRNCLKSVKHQKH